MYTEIYDNYDILRLDVCHSTLVYRNLSACIHIHTHIYNKYVFKFTINGTQTFEKERECFKTSTFMNISVSKKA